MLPLAGFEPAPPFAGENVVTSDMLLIGSSMKSVTDQSRQNTDLSTILLILVSQMFISAQFHI